MHTQLIHVGNSRGIRLPKALLQQCGIVDAVDLRITDEGLLLSPVRTVRAGWEESIALDEAGPIHDELGQFRAVGNVFDAVEWTWPTS